MFATDKKQKAISQLIKEQLNYGKCIHFRVKTNSMEPFIRIGDEVVVKKINPKNLIPNNVILFEKGNTFFTHRYIRKIEKNGTINYLTRGDKLGVFDIPFPESKIMGKVVMIKRNKKQIDLTLQKHNLLDRLIFQIYSIQWIIYKYSRFIRKSFILKEDNFLMKILSLTYKLSNRFLNFYLYSVNKKFNSKDH